MDDSFEAPRVPLELAVRIGCKLQFEAIAETPMLLNVKPRHDAYQLITQERLDLSPVNPGSEFEDDHGNTVMRLSIPGGVTTVIYDAVAMVPAASEDFAHLDQPIPPHRLPAGLLRYTLPSRYCDSDKLRDFAWR